MIHPNFTVLSGMPIALEILDLKAETRREQGTGSMNGPSLSIDCARETADENYVLPRSATERCERDFSSLTLCVTNSK